MVIRSNAVIVCPRSSVRFGRGPTHIKYGIDVTLLIENLRCTPRERLRRHQQVLESRIALREEVQESGRQEWVRL